MRVLWTLFKIVVALVVAIPVSIIVLAAALGILGALVGIAILALKLAVFGLIGWGAYRLAKRLMAAPASGQTKSPAADLTPVDRYYQSAMRELDRELGPAPR
jgi:hypothetical protein